MIPSEVFYSKCVPSHCMAGTGHFIPLCWDTALLLGKKGVIITTESLGVPASFLIFLSLLHHQSEICFYCRLPIPWLDWSPFKNNKVSNNKCYGCLVHRCHSTAAWRGTETQMSLSEGPSWCFTAHTAHFSVLPEEEMLRRSWHAEAEAAYLWSNRAVT